MKAAITGTEGRLVMYRNAIRTLAGWLAATCGIVVLALNGVGTATAQEFYAPFNIQATGHYGACFSVTWQAEPTGVTSFSVERKEPYQRWEVSAAQRDVWACGMEPGNFYDYEVCSWYGTDDGDVECASARLQLIKVGNLEPSGPPPQPRIVETHFGETFIGLKWDAAGFEYDSYFVNYTLKGQGVKTIDHDDDGTWGYQRIDGLLPSRTYILQVQGCTLSFFGIGSDRCWDWSPTVEVTTAAYPLHSGPDTCAPGFVWREAFPEDHVCVSPPRRDAVRTDNAQGPGRRAGVCTEEMLRKQTCPFVIPDTCAQGYVWREARPEDRVCVAPPERDLVRQENATAHERRARP
jgi:hypothetical protein